MRLRAQVTVILPAGTHTVDGTPNQSLPVGSYAAKGAPRRRRTPVPAPDALVTEIHTMEEKGSDVNLAAHLLNDAWKQSFDIAVVISNDTDLCAPIAMVVNERKLPVIVINPNTRFPVAPRLAAVATGTRHMRPGMLAASQFPDPIPGSAMSKPASW